MKASSQQHKMAATVLRVLLKQSDVFDYEMFGCHVYLSDAGENTLAGWIGGVRSIVRMVDMYE